MCSVRGAWQSVGLHVIKLSYIHHTHTREGEGGVGNERRDEEHCHFQCDMFCIVLQQFLYFLHAQEYSVKKRAKGRFEMKIGQIKIGKKE